MPKLPSLNRLPGHQKFEYTPRHYDPVKDDLGDRYGSEEEKKEERISKAKISNHYRNMRAGVRSSYKGKKTGEMNKGRLILIILSLTLILWKLLA